MAWFASLFRRRPERAAESEIKRRMTVALERQRHETTLLGEDGRELRERIRKNARTGRTLLGGSRPL